MFNPGLNSVRNLTQTYGFGYLEGCHCWDCTSHATDFAGLGPSLTCKACADADPGWRTAPWIWQTWCKLACGYGKIERWMSRWLQTPWSEDQEHVHLPERSERWEIILYSFFESNFVAALCKKAKLATLDERQVSSLNGTPNIQLNPSNRAIALWRSTMSTWLVLSWSNRWRRPGSRGWGVAGKTTTGWRISNGICTCSYCFLCCYLSKQV